MQWDYLNSAVPLAIAHRGGALEAPQNTMAAFDRAIGLGYRYLELDVRATSDGELAVFHDYTLEALTGRPGAVHELTWSELCQAKVLGREPIPRLEEVLAAWPDVNLNLDPKHHNAVLPLVKLLRQRDYASRVCLSTFSDRRLRMLSKHLADDHCIARTQGLAAWWRLKSLLGGNNSSTAQSATPDRQRDLTRGCVQVPATIHKRRLVDERFVAAVHAYGHQVHVWTVNDPVEMRQLLALGVDGIFTDRPEVLKDVLAELGQWHAPTAVLGQR